MTISDFDFALSAADILVLKVGVLVMTVVTVYKVIKYDFGKR
jgi:hypothetical protein